MALNKKSQNVLSILGKEALADIKSEDPDGRTEMLDVTLIDENPDNVEVFDMENIDLLANDIKKYGFRGAIEVLDKKNGHYEVLSGHRRLRAVKSLGWDKIRCFIRQRDPAAKENDRLTVEELLLANMRNRDITPMQKSRAVKLYFDKVLDVYYPLETHAQKVGRACEFFGLKSAIIDRLLGFQTLNERFKEYIDLPGFPVHGLIGTKRMDEEEITLLIDSINRVPGFNKYKDGLESCPLTTKQLSEMVHKVIDEFSKTAVASGSDLYEEPISSEPRPVEDLETISEELTTGEPLDFDDDKSENVTEPHENNDISASEHSVSQKYTPAETETVRPSKPIASSSRLQNVDNKTMDLAEASGVERKAEDSKPKVADIKTRTESYYYQMRAYLDTIPFKAYNEDDRHAIKVILDTMMDAIKDYSEQL